MQAVNTKLDIKLQLAGLGKSEPIVKRIANELGYVELVANAKEFASKQDMLGDQEEPVLKYSEGMKRAKFLIEDAEDLELAYANALKSKSQSITIFIKTSKTNDKVGNM